MMDSEVEVSEKDHDHPPHLLNDRFYEHANQPRNIGGIPKAEGKATGVGVCGDSIEIYLSIRNQAIVTIGQVPHGCTYTVACGSAVSQLVTGKSLEEALRVTPDAVSAELGGLPEDHMHCASLAVNTLGEAIDDYYRKIWGNREEVAQ
ncbi:MAG: iron-sulfur cluster assembly scaffold protein [Desulfatirhabdiaceae bacterium]